MLCYALVVVVATVAAESAGIPEYSNQHASVAVAVPADASIHLTQYAVMLMIRQQARQEAEV